MPLNPENSDYDVIIVGAGAGGCAAAYGLVQAGLRVALVEKGHELPRDASTLDVQQVIEESRFKSREVWLDRHGGKLCPEEYFNIGGKTKWYGAALLRYSEDEFNEDSAHACRGWPFRGAELAPYYAAAERLLGVREFACEPDLARVIKNFKRRQSAWRPHPLPLALSAEILQHPNEASHFDGFASPRNLKGDAETTLLTRVRDHSNLKVLTRNPVVELIAAAGESRRIGGVQLADGTRLHGRTTVLAAGALHSPRLLQRYLVRHGLATSWPSADNVGRNLKLHLLTAMVAISWSRKTDVIRKTTYFTHARYPHSSVQPLGFDGELIATLVPKLLPRSIARMIGARAYGFFLQTEDGAHPHNRVIAESAATDGLPQLDYDATRTPVAVAEHRRLIAGLRGELLRAGWLPFSQRIGLAGTAHASGTLTCGDDPRTSVVDAVGQVHGLESLYVADGSVLPRSSRVNPSLTIFAWSLRLAAVLAQRLRDEHFQIRDARAIATN